MIPAALILTRVRRIVQRRNSELRCDDRQRLIPYTAL